jgi:hypothetical protein
MASFVISPGIANIHRDPDPASEVVTQALMNMPAEAGDSSGDWTHITLSDYSGWIRSEALEEPIVRGFCKVGEYCGTALPLLAVVSAMHTPLYSEASGNDMSGCAYLSTALPIIDITDSLRLQVALPGERGAWIERGALAIERLEEPYPRQAVRVVTGYARQFLGRPYLWGGTSWEGLDCSGFVQLCYRMGGYILPRDARQQHDFLIHDIERDTLREGDLLFFGTRSITHVALALNADEYIHSEGQNYDRVLINSFRPGDPHYYPRLDEIFWGAKRVIV